MAFIQNFAPNWKNIQFTLPDGNWNQVTTFPGFTDATRFQAATLRSVATGGVTDGSAFQFSLNQTVAPTVGKLVSGSGQTETIPGAARSLWVKGTSGDILNIEIYW